jgi:hypothetical protein
MKILHIGGLREVSWLLTGEQRKAGHQVSCWGLPAADSFLELPLSFRELLDKCEQIVKEKYQVIQFHMAQSLCDPDKPALEKTLEVLKKLAASGAKLCLFSYGTDSLCSLASKEPLLQIILSDHLQHLYIGAADHRALSKFSNSWSFLPIPLNLEEVPAPPSKEPQAREIKILYLPLWAAKEEVQRVNQIVATLKAADLKFHFTAVHGPGKLSRAQFDLILSQSDLVIEHLSQSSVGVLGLQAMLNGKTVLSGNSAEARKAWDQLSLSPVLDTTVDNLEKRLMSIIREPRCLKDLGQRSRQYVERCHNSKVVSQMMLDVYRKVVERK